MHDLSQIIIATISLLQHAANCIYILYNILYNLHVYIYAMHI